MDCGLQSPLSMGFSSQEYWNGLPFPTQGNCLVAELVKNLPAVQETQVQSLSWEDPILCKLRAIKKVMLQSYNDVIKYKVSQVFLISEKKYTLAVMKLFILVMNLCAESSMNRPVDILLCILYS